MTQFNEVVEHPEAPIRPTVYALLVALTGQQRKGHELGQAAASTTGGVVQLGPGTLYRTLQRMRVEGLIEEVDGQDPKKAHTDPQTEGLRDYRITDAGRRALEAMASRMSVLTDSATSKGVKARREAAAARKNGKPAPLPEEFNSVLPHIIVSDAAAAADFYKKAFDADELYRDSGPDGRIWHLELLIGNTRLPLSDEFAGMRLVSPSREGNSVILHHYVVDADATFKRAVAAGAQPLLEPNDGYWGDRYAQIQDPFGHRWAIASRFADPSPAEERGEANKFRKENPDLALEPPM